MKAVILEKPGKFVVKEIDTPEIGDNEVLIKIYASGICTNDVRDFKGECNYSYPRIGGHEYCGTIVSMGKEVNKNHFAIGQKAVQYIIDDCKECCFCKSKQENICENLPLTKTFQNPGGLSGYCGFAEYINAKAEDVVVFPDDADFADMVFTEPLACAVNSVNHTNIKFGDDVLVIGGGTMGLLHVMLAKLKGARVILSEPMAERRKKALKLGCDYAFDSINDDIVSRVKELTGGHGANVVFNTTAIPAIAKQAVELTIPGGTAVMFSSIHPNKPVEVDMGAVHSFQKTITGAVSPTIDAYYQAVLLISKKIINPAELIEDIIPYKDFGKAIALASQSDTYKVILKFGEF
ncbi:zinc-dependent alcohol dehydrogenase [Pectinatus haikarae]|uniref:Threonine dehydrogenase-like Zn-dependent dehydrogenase n=1 Tax=Pectinatus haikarae TaxID=349096 RepID=A0ABT9YBB1_9FIRM|nr:zinc-binding dehydrogenase [Pectinatus haikarae]MDQ0205097.1 threonine dehydrogenase-like Zn-dependent dehydrogenase [Pectinatus haikarae]